MHAEHGLWSKPRGASRWSRRAPAALPSADVIAAILEDFAQRTPGAFVEKKSSVLAWHWRLADPEFGARQSNELMSSIARESHEQASAIEEVNAAVRQMDQMTQHNAALVEETNAAIEQTEAQATELDKVVEVFKAEGESSGKTEKVAAAAVRRAPKAARTAYLSEGNAAIDKDWTEF